MSLFTAYPNYIMEKYVVYPIIATEFNDEDGHYFVATSPNIEGMVTQGHTMAKLAYQAEDAIATMLDGETYPVPQDPLDWKLKPNERIVYIAVDMAQWLKKNTKTVKRTITVPEYLNDLAKNEGLMSLELQRRPLKQNWTCSVCSLHDFLNEIAEIRIPRI